MVKYANIRRENSQWPDLRLYALIYSNDLAVWHAPCKVVSIGGRMVRTSRNVRESIMTARLDSLQHSAAVFSAILFTAGLVVFSGVIAPLA